ncbi:MULTISPECIES: hypothetical protein [Rhodobacterales]|uniref:hypothetical protein n=1 Tax=Roseobacter sp. N2S TaxID=2663844 RepID=UPI0028607788|nr:MULTISPECIES: hypothetical protein [Rhodobacterales]MDR6264345.1 fumarate reductase subunit C [Roseobacter sp. N2S]
MSKTTKQFVLRNLCALAVWFVVITFIIMLYADETDPMPVSIWLRLLISAGIVVFVNIPLVKSIGRIFLNTTPDDPALDD